MRSVLGIRVFLPQKNSDLVPQIAAFLVSFFASRGRAFWSFSHKLALAVLLFLLTLSALALLYSFILMLPYA